MKIQVLLLVVIWLAESYGHETHRILPKEEYYWDTLDFQFPNDTARKIALCTGSYIPEKNTIWGLGVWRDKIFVSIFRLGVGVASALNYFSMNSTTKSPVLIPYPSFDANYVNEDPLHKTLTLPGSSSIISAQYFRIDKCNRIWILDGGGVDFFGQSRQISPPAIVLFDLITNSLILRYPIPAEFINSNSVYTNLDIDFKGTGCDNVFAYIVDAFRTIVVYSLKKNRSWRLVHNFFGSDPQAGNFVVDGRNFQWNYGIVGITIGGRQHDGSRHVYVNPFASTKSFYISNKVLQNEAYVALNNYFCDVHPLGDRGQNGQIFTWAYDEKTNVLFDTQFYRRRITCWNTKNSYVNSSFAVLDQKKTFYFPNDVRIDNKRNLWVLSNSLSTFLYGSWNAGVKNIRIFKVKVDDVILGTVCSVPKHN